MLQRAAVFRKCTQDVDGEHEGNVEELGVDGRILQWNLNKSVGRADFF
jgi:hypothetical protein